MMPALDISRAPLHQPSLAQLRDCLQDGLAQNYAQARVQIENCPDLREWGCPAAGICGSEKIIEVGGEPYLHNPKHRPADFDLNAIAQAIGAEHDFVYGAWSPSLTALGGKSGEVVVSRRLGGDNSSLLARVGEQRECIVEPYPHDLYGGLANACACDGKVGPTLKIEASHRTGAEASFTQTLRQALGQLVPASGGAIALAGIFRVLDGTIKSHVQPDYETIKHDYYDTDQERVTCDFLQFYEGVGQGLLCFSVLWSGTPAGPELHLRPNGEHTHFCSLTGKDEAGHYHNDTSPEVISYSGYFTTAGELFRVNDIYRELGRDRQ